MPLSMSTHPCPHLQFIHLRHPGRLGRHLCLYRRQLGLYRLVLVEGDLAVSAKEWHFDQEDGDGRTANK